MVCDESDFVKLSLKCRKCLVISSVHRPVARGGSVGSDEPPSQIKDPLFCAKRSTFYNKRSTFYNKRSLFSPTCKQKVHYKENESPLSIRVHQYFIQKAQYRLHTKCLFFL